MLQKAHTWSIFVMALAIAGCAAPADVDEDIGSVALASSVHLKPPSKPPGFIDNVLTLFTGGDLAGLGNGDVKITVSAMANPIATCTNNGTHQAPGQNPPSVTVTGSQSIPASEVDNGNVSFGVTTDPPVT